MPRLNARDLKKFRYYEGAEFRGLFKAGRRLRLIEPHDPGDDLLQASSRRALRSLPP